MVDSDCKNHVPYRCKSHSIWPDGASTYQRGFGGS